MPRPLLACALGALLLACSSEKESHFVDDEVGAAPAPQARDPYFTRDGKQQFAAMRNLTGRDAAEIERLLDKARDEGTTLVRFHVTHGGFGRGITSDGEVDEAWAAAWDRVFAHAAADGIQVIPVFGVWADWNDGSNGEGWHAWDENPLNARNGGPAASPADLYEPGSLGQRVWVRWLGRLVKRWQAHANVAAWEVFSELDLVTWRGSDHLDFRSAAVAFYEAAAERVRALDPARRPVTASTSYWVWPALWQSPALELVELHLYGSGDPATPFDLDVTIIDTLDVVRRSAPGKPILLGESGLDYHAPHGDTDDTRPFAPIAARHAVWAALVSGAMTGRALWWQDAYAILENGESSVPFVRDFPAIEAGLVKVLGGRSLAGFQPLGDGTLADDRTVIGWTRSPTCGAPSWDCSSPTDAGAVPLSFPGDALRWRVSFFDPATGDRIGDPVDIDLRGPDEPAAPRFPAFTDDLAFTVEAIDP